MSDPGFNIARDLLAAGASVNGAAPDLERPGEPPHPYIPPRPSLRPVVTAPKGDGSEETFALPGLHVVPADQFAAVDEASAEPLLGDEENTVLSAGGTLAFYGDGGAGKTTLETDLVMHLAAGIPWLGLTVPRPVKVLVIENEGPRGKFRRKLRAKLAAWEGPSIEGGILVLEEPWAMFSFAEEAHREALRAVIVEHEIDIIAAGPVQALGMQGGGTPDEVGAFMLAVELTRAGMERPLAVVLVHHENKQGDVSGAWQGRTDTLAHLQPQGNGATRMFWRKVRWGSTLHEATWKLLWRDGESFELDKAPERTDEDIEEAIAAFVRENPGASWNTADSNVEGKANRKRDARDRLLESGALVNAGKGQKFALSVAGDPLLTKLRPDGDAPGTQFASRTGWPAERATASRVPPKRGRGDGDALTGNPERHVLPADGSRFCVGCDSHERCEAERSCQLIAELAAAASGGPSA